MVAPSHVRYLLFVADALPSVIIFCVLVLVTA